MSTSSAIAHQEQRKVRMFAGERALVQQVGPALLFFAALAVRIAAWHHFGTGTIESEGAEYTKIAQNLRAGAGYIGLVSAGPQVLFPPLFPWLIALASYITPDFEFAGRLVALLFGAILPLPVLGIASRLFTRRIGWIAAAMVALHPVSVSLSFSVYSEGIYATLFLVAAYCSLRALEVPSTKAWLLVGASFALCYMVRPEGFAAFALTLLFGLFALKLSLSTRIKRLVSAFLIFLALASPNIIFLYRKTGKLQLEGKSSILFSYAGSRMLAAMRHPGVDYESAGGLHETPSPDPDREGGYPERWEEKWAFYGVNSDLKETGVAMRPWVDVARLNRSKPQDMIRLVLTGIARNIPNLYFRLFSTWIGYLLPVFAVLGIFLEPWQEPRALMRFYFLVVSAAPVIATFFIFWGDERYYFIFVPLLSVWAANGIYGVASWTERTILAAGWQRIAPSGLFRYFVPAIITLAVVIAPIRQVRRLYTFSESAPPALSEKKIGLWISQMQDHPVRVMDLTLPLSFHANVQQHIYFPYSDGDVALRYLDAARIDYVVLRRDKKFTKYYEQWLQSGIPSKKAELLRLPPEIQSENITVYRWNY